jgi:hypothetical protein
MIIRSTPMLTAAAATLCFLTTGAFAATVYQTGFEAPTITTGLLSGQDNWSGSGSGATTVVETSVVHSGSQAVIVTPGTGNNFGVQHADAANLSGSSILSVSDYVNFSSTGSATYWTPVGTFYSAGGNILLNVDTSGQIVLSINGNNTGTGVHVSTGTWNQLGMVINYATGTVTAYDNGIAAGSAAFNDSTDLNLTTFQFYSQPNGAVTPQVAYFDDVSITTSTVTPEPASALSALAGISALGLLRRCRRQLS